MRPVFHPAIAEVRVEAVLHALSDPTRMAIFAEVVGQECPQNCSSFLQIGAKAIPKSTLSQHFKLLREAGLIRSERQGIEMQNTSRCAEIDARFPGLIAAIVRAYEVQGAARKSRRGVDTR